MTPHATGEETDESQTEFTWEYILYALRTSHAIISAFTKYLKGDEIKWPFGKTICIRRALQCNEDGSHSRGGVIQARRPQKHSRWPQICP